MFTVCKLRHSDPIAPKFGTMDVAVLRQIDGRTLFYSIVQDSRKFEELQVYPCYEQDQKLFKLPTTSKGLRQAFQEKAGEMLVTIICMDDLDTKAMLKTVDDDLATMPEMDGMPLVFAMKACFGTPSEVA